VTGSGAAVVARGPRRPATLVGMTPPRDPWVWPDDWSWPQTPGEQATVDLAHHLEQAARALREGRAAVHRSSTSTTTNGPNRLDVDLTWSPTDPV